MKSPFPGMDPYLEAHWGDVHTRLIVYASEQLQPLMPAGLHVRVEEYVSVRADDDANGHDEGRFQPDLHIQEQRRSKIKASSRAGGATLAEPIFVPLQREPRTQRSLRIVDSRAGQRVVTAIEFLSPWNKRNASARKLYSRKRRVLRRGQANFVEVDLHRRGPYILMAPQAGLPQTKSTNYRACVWRAARPGRVEYYAFPLRERLPAIAVPLRSGDADARLDLQVLINQVYAKGAFTEIDYHADPEQPLAPPDAAWADKLLRAKGVR